MSIEPHSAAAQIQAVLDAPLSPMRPGTRVLLLAAVRHEMHRFTEPPHEPEDDFYHTSTDTDKTTA